MQHGMHSVHAVQSRKLSKKIICYTDHCALHGNGILLTITSQVSEPARASEALTKGYNSAQVWLQGITSMWVLPVVLP
jgi:hypothetical protein